MKLINLYRLAHWLYIKHIPLLPTIIYYLQYLLFNCSVPPTVVIGKGTSFGYGGIAIVIHARVIIGSNCIISQCVTIGGTSKLHDVPIIGNDVFISAGAKVIGPVKIGDNVVIGANAVVNRSIPSNSLVVGVPGKVIKTGIYKSDYV